MAASRRSTCSSANSVLQLAEVNVCDSATNWQTGVHSPPKRSLRNARLLMKNYVKTTHEICQSNSPPTPTPLKRWGPPHHPDCDVTRTGPGKFEPAPTCG